ncbi:MAG TPA: hypothetical protein H9730_11075 [Candidatus Mediterraneibacter stercoripullorum]|nr:hypothetical protein [Candidatus Mediterraneibacter stercoripullorum]
MPKKVTSTENTVNREYKSSIFAMLFRDKTRLLELYNAISKTEFTDPDLLKVVTLENAIYMGLKNDLSFIVLEIRLYLYEHQSTPNPNMPLRDLLYVADEFSDLTKDMNLYGSRKIRIPAPHFFIFYNGEEERPDRDVLKLSDLYYEKEEDPSLELKAVVLNINKGHNPELMETCRTLREYAEYTDRVRRYAKEMPLEEAVEQAITECIREGILEDFLKKNRAEAMKVSIYEYDAQKHIEMEREDSYKDGYQAGRDDGYQSGKEDGYQSGREDGYQAGKDDGYQTGKGDGRTEMLRQVIRTMLTNGKTVSQIAADLGMDEKSVSDLGGKA